MELIRRFRPDEYTEALSSWAWLDGLAGMTPALTNVFGDVFLQNQDGSFSFLDTVEDGWIGSGRMPQRSKPTSTIPKHKTST